MQFRFYEIFQFVINHFKIKNKLEQRCLSIFMLCFFLGKCFIVTIRLRMVYYETNKTCLWKLCFSFIKLFF